MFVASPATARTEPPHPNIVAIFDAANTWDVETSTLGEKGHDEGSPRELREDVRARSRHRAQQGRDLAKKLGVTPTPPKDFAMAAEHAAATKKLEGLSARRSSTYLENEVAYHKAVIDAINSTLLPALKNAEVKTLVVTVAPVFKAHESGAEPPEQAEVARP